MVVLLSDATARLIAVQKHPELVLLTMQEALGTPFRGAPGMPITLHKIKTHTAKVHAWVVGCGVDKRAPNSFQSKAVKQLLKALKGSSTPVVVDAGALELLPHYSKTRKLPETYLLTPHLGEMARLLSVDASEIRQDPEGAARQAHERFGGTVLLKGNTTRIVNSAGIRTASDLNPYLAVAVSGDVLAGMLGASLAQNAARSGTLLPEDMLEIAHKTVLAHSEASRRANPDGHIVATDIISALRLRKSQLQN